MSNATSNRARIGYLAETTYGGTISAALKTLRFNEESIARQKNAAWSGQIEANGNRVEVQDLSHSAAGSFTSELSYTDFLAFLIAAIRAGAGTPDTPAAGTTRYTNSNTLKSFYLEKQFTDISAFVGIYGAVISQLDLTFAANQPVMAQFGFMAQKATKEAATRGTGAIQAASTDAVMRSGIDVAHVKLGGSAIAAAVQRLTLSINNNVRPTTEVTKDCPQSHNLGAFEVSGSMLVYFPSTTLYDDMIAHTSRALEVKVGNAAGAFTLGLPSIRLTGGTPPISGQNQDVMVELPFMAEMGGGGFTMNLDDTPAA